jgi:hypothetical protein
MESCLGMGQRRFMWSVSLPLAALGWLAGHTLAYALVVPHHEHREELLAETGHSYLSGAPHIVSCALTLVLAGLVLAAYEGVRGHARVRTPAWPVVLLPPLGFAAAEHLERLIEHNAFPTGAALEPTFIVGIALQLPLGAAALLVANAVLAFGHALGRRAFVVRALRLPAWEPLPPLPAHPEPVLVRAPVLAGGHGQRAPPRTALV